MKNEMLIRRDNLCLSNRIQGPEKCRSFQTSVIECCKEEFSFAVK